MFEISVWPRIRWRDPSGPDDARKAPEAWGANLEEEPANSAGWVQAMAASVLR